MQAIVSLLCDQRVMKSVVVFGTSVHSFERQKGVLIGTHAACDESIRSRLAGLEAHWRREPGEVVRSG